jgi:hypothetical protein
MNQEEVSLRAQTALREFPSYGEFVDRAIGIMYLAYEFGWKVALLLNDERSVRNAESLLGIHLRRDFEPKTQLASWFSGDETVDSLSRAWKSRSQPSRF